MPRPPAAPAAFLAPTALPSQNSAANSRRQCRRIHASGSAFPSFLPRPHIHAIRDTAAVVLAERLTRPTVQVANHAVPSSLFHWRNPAAGPDAPTLVLIHGFDSSVLEFRRLLPLLTGSDSPYAAVLALDVLGWGFTERPHAMGCGPDEKRQHLRAVLAAELGEPRGKVVLAGASLGAAIAIDYALCYPGEVAGMVFIDGQAFTDAKKPLFTVRALDRLGVAVLKSRPLRTFANNISYYDQETYRNLDDFVNIGKLPCEMPGWEESQLLFIASEKYAVSQRLGDLDVERALVIFGRDDKIIPSTNAAKFLQALDEKVECNVEIIPQCGHVPHIEKPETTAQLILDFAECWTGAAQLDLTS